MKWKLNISIAWYMGEPPPYSRYASPARGFGYRSGIVTSIEPPPSTNVPGNRNGPSGPLAWMTGMFTGSLATCTTSTASPVQGLLQARRVRPVRGSW
ncbi:MAG: hypothetical protein NTX64_19115 [Elusimicrobia bacterium]|nr:hypothetical protein [Elusimicrobiota bacterium]